MAKKLTLEFSSRKNIINWLEGFRDNGLGLKQSTLDFFDAGNNYSTNEKIDMFNEKVEILVKALKASGEDVGKERDGRYSIKASMLKRFTPQHFTPELKEFVFNSDVIGVKFDNKTADVFMAKAYKKNKEVGFDHQKYFLEFANAGNIKALDWLVKTYGVNSYDMNLTVFKAFKFLISKTSEADAVDHFITMGIIPLAADLTHGNSTFSLRRLLELSEDSLTKIIPLIKTDDTTNGDTLINLLKDLYDHSGNGNLVKLLSLSNEQLESVACEIMGTVQETHFQEWEKLIICLVGIYPGMLTEMLHFTDSKIYDNIVSLAPEVRDIFLF